MVERLGVNLMEPLRIGVIGCGSIAKHRHIPEYAQNPNVKLVAFSDDVLERAQEYATKYGAKAYDDYKTLLENEKLDAVSVCTPNAFHAPISIAAMKKGIHVLCEKPMSITLEEAEEMIQTAKDNNVQLMIGYNQRYFSPHVIGRDIIQSGRLGKVLSFRTTFAHGGPEQWSVEKENSWFFDKKKAFIGSLGDLGVHKIDLITWLLNEKITEISALIATLQKPGDVDDNAVIIAKMANGAIGTITTSWTHVPGEDNSTIIHFENGTMRLVADPEYPLIVEYNDGNVEKHVASDVSTNEVQVNSGVIDAFIDALVQKEPVPITGVDGLHSIKVVLAALESSKEGLLVSINY
jgi:UDP-N-acetylglucosamine 3-dehydrogenase